MKISKHIYMVIVKLNQLGAYHHERSKGTQRYAGSRAGLRD